MTLEKDMTLGEYLRHERERRGVTIEQVASATKVGVRALHSLEADHFAELPAKPFIRGFITSYCRFIGLDPKDVLSRFDGFIQKKSLERPNREGGHSGYAFEKKDGEQQSRTVLTVAIVSFIVLGGLAMLFLKPSLRHRHHSHIDKLRAVKTDAPRSELEVLSQHQSTPSPLPAILAAVSENLAPGNHPGAVKKTEPAPAVTPEPSIPVPAESPVSVPAVSSASSTQAAPALLPVPLSSPSETPASSLRSGEQKYALGANPDDPLDSGHSLKGEAIHHKVIVRALADIWVRYQADDRPIRKFIIRNKKTLILRAQESIWLQVSNPNSAEIQYNGKARELVNDAKNRVMKQSVNTLFYPRELSEKIEEPFTGGSPIPQTPDPVLDKTDSVTPQA